MSDNVIDDQDNQAMSRPGRVMAGQLCGFVTVFLLLPLLLFFRRLGGADAVSRCLWVVAALAAVLLLLFYAVTTGVFYYRLLRAAEPELSARSMVLLALGGVAGLMFASLYLLLPCLLRRRQYRAAVPAALAGVTAFAALPAAVLEPVSGGDWFFLPLLALSLLLHLAAIRGAAPAARLGVAGFLVFALFAVLTGGVWLYGEAQRRQIDGLRVELEEMSGMALTEAAFWERDRAGTSPEAAPWRELFADNQTGVLNETTPPDFLPTAAERKTFAAWCAKHAELAARLEALTATPIPPLAHRGKEFFYQIELPEFGLMRGVARFYAMKLRVAAIDGDRDGVLDALARIGQVRDFTAAQPFIISGLVTVAIERIRLQALAAILPLSVLSEADWEELAAELPAAAAAAGEAVRRSLAGEIITVENMLGKLMPQKKAIQELRDMGVDLSRPRSLALTPWLFRCQRREEWIVALTFYRELWRLWYDETLTGEERYERGQELERQVPEHCRFCRLLLPALPTVAKRITELTDNSVAARLGIAVERYRRKYGRPPATLAALAPEFLDAVPLDRRRGEPYGYEYGRIEIGEGKEKREVDGYRIGDPLPAAGPFPPRREIDFTVILSEDEGMEKE